MTHTIGNTRKNMSYIKNELVKSNRMHSSLSRGVDTLEMLIDKSHTYARTNLMKFNNIVQRSGSANDNLDERIKVKKDPAELLATMQESLAKRSGRREELEMADKFKQRIVLGFERAGRAYMKEWIIKMSKKNEKQGKQIMTYMNKMHKIDNAFTTMKSSDCEIRIEELIKAVESSYNENNRCLARLSEIEGGIIETEGKHDRAQTSLVADLERISMLNNTKQVDEETRLRIEGMLDDDTKKYMSNNTEKRKALRTSTK